MENTETGNGQITEANRVPKKKHGHTPLEVDRQKELVRHMTRWMDKDRKTRTQGKLRSLSGVAATTISDAFKPGTITKTESTLSILRVVASYKQTSKFIIEFMPDLRDVLNWIFQKSTKSGATFESILRFMEVFWDEAENLRGDVMDQMRRTIDEIHDKALLINVEGKQRLVGGRACGPLIQIGDENFASMAAEPDEQFILVKGENYKMVLINREHRTAIYRSPTGDKSVFVYTDRSSIFESS